jgi:uncharacterized beta-barrel protein YwiB (DUF1934 family)
MEKGYIKVDSTQYYTDKEKDSTVFTSEVQYQSKGSLFYLKYLDIANDVGKDIENKIIISSDFLKIERTGMGNNKLIFNKDRLWDGFYPTPYGVFQIQTKLISLNKVEGDNVISFQIEYEILFEMKDKIRTVLKIDIANELCYILEQ